MYFGAVPIPLSWAEDHIFVEMEGNISFGAQATFTIVEGVPVLVPYTNADQLAFSLNVGSVTLAGKKINNREGVLNTSVTDKVWTQGFAAAFDGFSMEYKRKITNGVAETPLEELY